jgi:hypothetical protein
MVGTAKLEKLWMSTCAGAPGVALTGEDVAPSPTAFLARTSKSYEVPLDKPLTIADGVVLVPSLNTAHVPPVVNSYSTI